ncbi:MAG: hypothetical protein ACTS5I_10985, partial [Rhodanobacter sp.]
PLGIHFWLLSGGIAALALLLGSAMAWLGTKAEDRPWQILQAVLLGSVVLLLIDLSTYRFDASLLLAHLPWALGLWACLAATFWLLRQQPALWRSCCRLSRHRSTCRSWPLQRKPARRAERRKTHRHSFTSCSTK